MESVHPVFGTTLARRLNQSYVPAVFLLNLTAIDLSDSFESSILRLVRVMTSLARFAI